MTTAESTRRPLQPVLPPGGLSIKIVGLGGVGEKVARYLSLHLASLHDVGSRVVLIDADHFEPVNAARMHFTKPGNKAAVVRDDLRPFLAGSQVTLLAIEEFITRDNIARLIASGDQVFVCVDNHATRKLVSDYCAGLDAALPAPPAEVTLIGGGNDGVETRPDGRVLRGTYANTMIFLRRDGINLTPDWGRFHPEIRAPRDRAPTEKGCAELMHSVPQLLFTNLACASAMLNAWFLLQCRALPYSELCLDIAEGLSRPVLPLDPAVLSKAPG